MAASTLQFWSGKCISDILMSISSYTSPVWVDSEIQQGEINCHSLREPMVKPETRQYHTWWQMQSLAHIWTGRCWLWPSLPSMLWPSPPTLEMPGFTPVLWRCCQDPASLAQGASSCHEQAAGHIAPFVPNTEECPCQPVTNMSSGIKQTPGLDPRAAIP